MTGVTYSTFREACEKRGVIEMDKSIDDCLTEATTFYMPSALRRLFASLLPFLCSTRPPTYMDYGTSIRTIYEKTSDGTIATR